MSESAGELDYRVLLARHGQTHWWTTGMRCITWALLGQVQGRVLDDGCGPGWTLLDLPEDVLGIGIDRDLADGVPEGIPPAIAAGASRRTPPRLVLADAARLPFCSAALDVVLALDLLEQRRVDALAALREAKRVLAPGGRLLARVPAHPWLYGPHDPYWGGARRYRKQEFGALVAAAGFTVRRLSYVNSLLFPLGVATRLLARAGLMGGEDLKPLPGPANRFFLALLELEARWLRRHDLPMGLSIICLAE